MNRITNKYALTGVGALTAALLAACGGTTPDDTPASPAPDGAEDSAGTSETAAGAGGEIEEQEFVFAYEGPEGTAQQIAADIFGEALEEASGGALAIEQFPAGQLGGEPDLLEKVRSGDLDFIISSTANAAAIAPESGVMSLHYLMGSAEEAIAVFSDEGVNQAYKEMAEEEVDGARPLTLFMLPLRNMYGNEEVRSIEDIKGKKIRVQATATEDAIFGAYGAQTVHMAFPELYSALQTGVVEMAENAVTYYGLNKHYEVAPIMSITEHEANGQVIWVSDNTFDNLDPAAQEAVEAAAEKVRQEQPSKAIELQGELQAKYEEMGVQFVTDVDKSGFQEISVPMQDDIAEDLGPNAVKILEQIRKVTGG